MNLKYLFKINNGKRKSQQKRSYITNELDTKTTEANKALSEEGNSDVFYVH